MLSAHLLNQMNSCKVRNHLLTVILLVELNLHAATNFHATKSLLHSSEM